MMVVNDFACTGVDTTQKLSPDVAEEELLLKKGRGRGIVLLGVVSPPYKPIVVIP